jgi:hypothetical protein
VLGTNGGQQATSGRCTERAARAML